MRDHGTCGCSCGGCNRSQLVHSRARCSVGIRPDFVAPTQSSSIPCVECLLSRPLSDAQTALVVPLRTFSAIPSCRPVSAPSAQQHVYNSEHVYECYFTRVCSVSPYVRGTRHDIAQYERNANRPELATNVSYEHIHST